MKTETVKITDVLYFQEGPGVRNTQFTSSGVKLLNVGNINNGVIDLDATKIYISEDEANGKYKHFLIDEGDLLIASSGIVVDNFHNKIAWAQAEHLPLCMNTSTIRFKALDKSRLDIKYFSFYLKTKHFSDQLRKLITGSAQLNFGPSHLKQISFPLPPLPIQKRIAEILDAADALKRKYQQLRKKYNELAQAIFINMFGDPVKNEKGWELKSLRSISEKISDGPFGSNLKTEHYADVGIRVIRLKNIGVNIFNDTDSAFISFNHYENVLKKYTCLPGDILIGTLGDPNLRACIFPDFLEKAVNKADCVMLRINPVKYNPQYVSYILNDPSFVESVANNLHGQTRTRISMGQVADLKIPIPPKSLQDKFSDYINLLMIQKEKLTIESDQSKLLWEALIQKAFNGELVN